MADGFSDDKLKDIAIFQTGAIDASA